MSGISLGTGLASGIDSRSLINQLIALESRPAILIQRRLINLQGQQAAYLDINSRLSALKTAADSFRIQNIFDTKQATSSDGDVLTATASGAAATGSYSFTVDRLVSSQQVLTRGFADRDTSAIGASSFTFESAAARLDRDIALSDLNGGDGIQRGSITVTQGAQSVEVDLSRVATVQDVLDALNDTGLDIQAEATGNGITVRSLGGNNFTITDRAGRTTAADLGILTTTATSTRVGDDVYLAGDRTALSALNDGNGVFVSGTVGANRFDFSITIDDGVNPAVTAQVNLGPKFDTDLTVLEGGVSTVGGVVTRINEAVTKAMTDAGLDPSLVSARVGSDSRIEIVNNTGGSVAVAENGTGTTARDLGILTGSPSTDTVVAGQRILANLNGTLLRNLNGGSGIAGTQLEITDRAGNLQTIDLSAAETMDDVISAINSAGLNITAGLNDAGTGIALTDTTATGSITGNLIVGGDAAASLGLETDLAGVASSTLNSGSLELAYVTQSTSVDKLNNGAGIGTGTMRFTDGSGRTAEVNIGTDTTNVFELLREINTQLGVNQLNLEAVINEDGDGLLIREKASQPAGSDPIKVEDVSGAVARNLRIAGESDEAGANNIINGSYETTIEFEPADTLEDIVNKINQNSTGVAATIINDGLGSSPFRLSLTSSQAGVGGRFTLDAGGFDLGISTLERGDDARVFFGSTNPADAVLLTNGANTLDQVIEGVTIDLKSVSDGPVELSVSQDTASIEEAVEGLLTAFNQVISRIDFQTRFDAETEVRGPLLGDGTLSVLRQSLFSSMQSQGRGLSGPFTSLFDVGLDIGEGGRLELDTEAFRRALETDPESVAELFEARQIVPKDDFVDVAPGVRVRNTSDQDEFSVLGVAGLVSELADRYVDSIDGVLRLRRNAIDSQIELQNQRLEAFNERIDNRRAVLQQQFLAMEQAIAQLQSQQGALAGLSAAG